MADDTRLRAALALARRGLHVFPLIPGKKLPAFSGWQDAATTDDSAIQKWFGPDAERAYNIGVFTGGSGLIVLDTDQKEVDGDANLRVLAGSHVTDLDNTFSVKSPTGSRHYYFRGPLVRDSVGKLAAAVDIRSRGGLVVGPGSSTSKGSYRVTNKAEIAAAPQWLLDAITAAYVKSEKVELAATVELDTTAAVDQATVFLAEAPIAVSGSGGNDRTYRTAARLKDIGLSEFMAGSLMLAGWNDRCDPPWGEDELLEIVRHAYQYGENSPGSASVVADFDILPDEPEIVDEDGDAEGLLDQTVDELAVKGLRRGYVIKKMVAPRDVVCLFGNPGAGKSLLGPHLAYMVGTGSHAFKMRTKQGAALYVAAEDHTGMTERLTALRELYGGTDQVRLIGRVSDLLTKGSVDLRRLLKVVKKRAPALVIIDTLSMAFPGLDENSAEGMGRVVAVARKIAKLGPAVILIHHGTKEGGDTPRGHGLLWGALDVAILLTREDSGVVHGRLTKNRNGPLDLDIAFRIGVRQIGTDEDGDPITAAYVDELEPLPEGPRADRVTPAEKAALALLNPLLGTNGTADLAAWRAAVITTPNAVSAAETVKDRRRVFQRIVESLARKRQITLGPGGAVTIPDNNGFETIPDDDLET